ncbi:MAG: outer membrane lipoprotein-sorting protein [Alkalispirochaeta sp.]
MIRINIELRSAVLVAVVLIGITRLAGAQSGGQTGASSADDLIRRARDLGPEQLMTLADDALFPESFVATMRMTTTRPGRRDTEMLLDNYHLEGAGSFMEVTEPRRSAGMRFLQKDEDLWMYNPRASSRRALRLSPRESFQGSVFSNNDVADPEYADDYTPSLEDTETLDHPEEGRVTTIRISAVASHDEAAYGRIEMWLMPDPEGATGAEGAAGASSLRVIPLRIDYFSRSGLPFKRMTLLEIGDLAGARRPRLMRMESLEEEGAVTTVRIESLEARDEIPSRLFSRQELTR